MKKLFLILSILFISGNIFALNVPKSSHFDSRIQRISYNENDVIEVNCKIGGSTQVIFSPEEQILDIAAGFSTGWEFEARRNNLYIKVKSVKGKGDDVAKPVPGKWDTDLHVTTNLRVYTFQLVLNPDEDPTKNDSGKDKKDALKNSAKTAYLIKFTYPSEEAARAKALLEEQKAQRLLAQGNAPQNWDYSMKVPEDAKGIAPSMAYDDGRFLYLKFPGNREFPAVFVVSSDGSESIANTHIDPKDPEMLVIHQLSPEFALRLGNQTVGIFNNSYDLTSVSTKNGATAAGVRRTIKVNKTQDKA